MPSRNQFTMEADFLVALRDWFAGQALTALVPKTHAEFPDVLARRAYAIADAMLAERAKP